MVPAEVVRLDEQEVFYPVGLGQGGFRLYLSLVQCLEDVRAYRVVSQMRRMRPPFWMRPAVPAAAAINPLAVKVYVVRSYRTASQSSGS